MRAVKGFARTVAAAAVVLLPPPLSVLCDDDDRAELALAAAASALARISFIWGTLVTTIRSTRASATRRIPQRAKGDWGRAKVGEISCMHLLEKTNEYVRNYL